MWLDTSLPVSVVKESLTSFKSVLIFCTRLVGNLDATSPLVRILEEVDVRALVKSVVSRLHVFRAIEVVNVCEASREHMSAIISLASFGVATHSVATFSSPCRAAILVTRHFEKFQLFRTNSQSWQ